MNTSGSTISRRDLVLLEQLQAGDADALAILYEHYSRILYQFVYRRTRLREVSREIVQEIFLSIWQRRTHLKIDASLRQYLFGAAKFKILDYQRAQRVRKMYAIDTRLYFSRVYDNAIEEQIGVEHVIQSVEHTLQEVSPRAQVVFRLSRFENKPIQEIADQLHISHRTVENYISLVLSKLRLNLVANTNL